MTGEGSDWGGYNATDYEGKGDEPQEVFKPQGYAKGNHHRHSGEELSKVYRADDVAWFLFVLRYKR